jgi:hypothetical protein
MLGNDPWKDPLTGQTELSGQREDLGVWSLNGHGDSAGRGGAGRSA